MHCKWRKHMEIEKNMCKLRKIDRCWEKVTTHANCENVSRAPKKSGEPGWGSMLCSFNHWRVADFNDFSKLFFAICKCFFSNLQCVRGLSATVDNPVNVTTISIVAAWEETLPAQSNCQRALWQFWYTLNILIPQQNTMICIDTVIYHVETEQRGELHDAATASQHDHRKWPRFEGAENESCSPDSRSWAVAGGRKARCPLMSVNLFNYIKVRMLRRSQMVDCS